MLTVSFGEEHALRIGNVHEDFIPQDMSQRIFNDFLAADSMADLLNNSIGRQIGNNNKGASNQQLAEAVLMEYLQNGLWQIVQNEDGSYLVELTKLSQEQYNDALEVLQLCGN